MIWEVRSPRHRHGCVDVVVISSSFGAHRLVRLEGRTSLGIAVRVMSWFGQHTRLSGKSRVRPGRCTHTGDVIEWLVLARRLRLSGVVAGGCNYIYRLMIIEVNVDVVVGSMIKVGESGISRFRRRPLQLQHKGAGRTSSPQLGLDLYFDINMNIAARALAIRSGCHRIVPAWMDISIRIRLPQPLNVLREAVEQKLLHLLQFQRHPAARPKSAAGVVMVMIPS